MTFFTARPATPQNSQSHDPENACFGLSRLELVFLFFLFFIFFLFCFT